MIQFFLLVSRQGKCRLSKWYAAYSDKDKKKMIREVRSTPEFFRAGKQSEQDFGSG